MKLKKLMCLVSVLLTCATAFTPVVSAAGAGEVQSLYAESGSTDELTITQIQERVKNLPKAINKDLYTYEIVNDETPEGEFYIYNIGYNNVMSGNYSSYGYSAVSIYDRNIIDESVQDDSKLPDSYKFTIKNTYKTNEEEHYSVCDSQGRYLTFNSNNRLVLTSTQQDFRFIRHNDSRGYVCWHITDYEKTRALGASSSKFTNSSFSEYYGQQYVCFLRKKLVKSIPNDTTKLYQQIVKAQYYTQYDPIEKTLLSALDDYEQAYNGGVEQQKLDSHTGALKSMLQGYETKYKEDLASIEVSIDAIFDNSDYKYTTLLPDVTEDDVAELKRSAEYFDLPYEYQVKLEKAEKIVMGKNVFEKGREFIPQRYGDLRSIANNQYKMWFWGTNKVPTGIWTSDKTKLLVYVEAEEDDPLPSIVFMQHISKSYLDKTIKLKRGLNYIECPYLHQGYTTDWAEQGGCIYLSNPYTEDQQSSNVRVYIEGGDDIITFNKGDNKNAFRKKLKDYYEKYMNGEEGYHNVVEMICKNSFMTLSMKRCYEAYTKEGMDPNETLEKWDEFTDYLFRIDGLDPDEFSHQKIQVKYNQPYAGAYATYEMIGIQNNEWLTGVISAQYGWGIPHELGHCLDNTDRLYSEITNNVWSTYEVLDDRRFADVCVMKSETELMELSDEDSTLFWSDDLKYVNLSMFWDLEVFSRGYWGRLDNMIRKKTCGNAEADQYISTVGQKEKIALYSSAAVGVDLTYYFKRCGYFVSTSYNYNNAIAALDLKKDQPKIWYYDLYSYYDNETTNTDIDDDISLAFYNRNSKKMIFNVPESCAKGHLGFEIMRDGKVVGFTWKNFFVDEKADPNCYYTYRINAYDRSLKVYSELVFDTEEDSTSIYYPVQILGRGYSSLKDAVNNAQTGDIIDISDNLIVDSNINISGKDITLRPYKGDGIRNRRITIINSQDNNDDMFTVNNGTLKVITNGENSIVFDGDSVVNQKCMFRLSNNAKLILKDGVTVQNIARPGWYRTTVGGFVNASRSTVELKGCLIQYNHSYRGTVYLTNGSVLDIDDGAVIRYNYSAYTGAVAYCNDKNSRIHVGRCEIMKNLTADKPAGGTFYMYAGTIEIGDGAYIHDNMSDHYCVSTAMYATKNAKIIISGNPEITDIINSYSTVTIADDMSGHVVLRVPSDKATDGLTVAVPSENGRFNDAILNNITYANDLYELINDGTSIFIGEASDHVVNKSAIDPAPEYGVCDISKDDSIIVKLAAEGGSEQYRYDIGLRRSDDSLVSWLYKDFDGAYAAVSVPGAGRYELLVNAKDSEGNADTKTFLINASVRFIRNTTELQSDIKVGEKLTIHASAADGYGSYTFSAYYRPENTSKWITIQKFCENSEMSFIPDNAGKYEVCVKARDENGVIDKKYFVVTAEYSFKNNSRISKDEMIAGDTITVTGEAQGGEGEIKYSVQYKKSGSEEWTCGRDYDTSTIIPLRFDSAGIYDIRVIAMDSNNNTSSKDFTVSVKTLSNISEISSYHLYAGNYVTVTGKVDGDADNVRYAVSYRKSDSVDWTTIQDFDANNKVKLLLSEAGNYKISVKAEYSGTMIGEKMFDVYVKNPRNVSFLSEDVVYAGKKITVYGSVEGLYSGVKYKFSYSKLNSDERIIIQELCENMEVELSFDEIGMYDIYVEAECDGKHIDEKKLTLSVKTPEHISEISSNSPVYAGETVTVYGKTNGGADNVKYAVYYKSADSDKWILVQDFDTNKNVELVFRNAGLYDVCVKAMYLDNELNERKMSVKVENPENISFLSCYRVNTGDVVTAFGRVLGGDDHIKYAVYYKKSDSDKWKLAQDFDENSEVDMVFRESGEYTVCVKAKYQKGIISKKYFSVDAVKYPLNISTLSATGVYVGDTVTVHGSTEGGTGTMRYAVFYKKSSESKWTLVQEFAENSDIDITFSEAGAYDICVKAKDSRGIIDKKYMNVFVDTNIIVAMSPMEINPGDEITIAVSSRIANDNSLYSFYYKKKTDTKWFAKQAFESGNVITAKPKGTGVYDLCVKVKYEDETVEKRYLTFTVKDS